MCRLQLYEREINICLSTGIWSFMSQLLLISNDKMSLHVNHQPLCPSPTHLTWTADSILTAPAISSLDLSPFNFTLQPEYSYTIYTWLNHPLFIILKWISICYKISWKFSTAYEVFHYLAPETSVHRLLLSPSFSWIPSHWSFKYPIPSTVPVILNIISPIFTA